MPDASAPVPRAGVPRCGMPWGAHLAGTLRPASLSSSVLNWGRGGRWQHNSWAAGSQVPAPGFAPHRHLQGLPPKQDALLGEGRESELPSGGREEAP